MTYFCTYFDKHYIPRGLALYQSLARHCPAFRLLVLCMDGECYETLRALGLEHIELFRLEDFEEGDDALRTAKNNRSRVEYYFTCTPSWCMYALREIPMGEILTYLDADMYLFSDPEPVFREISGHSIAITPHRFPSQLRHKEQYGLYNVGWLSFRNDDNGRECLAWWRERCIEWCYARLEDGRFADQKYLDVWPQRFRDLLVLQHKGVNAAPWNLANYRATEKNDVLFLDGQPLVCYHFHGLKQRDADTWDPNVTDYAVTLSRLMRRRLYGSYIMELIQIQQSLASSLGPMISDGIRNEGSGNISNMNFNPIKALRDLPRSLRRRRSYIRIKEGRAR